jgi:hypothetical protein
VDEQAAGKDAAEGKKGSAQGEMGKETCANVTCCNFQPLSPGNACSGCLRALLLLLLLEQAFGSKLLTCCG